MVTIHAPKVPKKSDLKSVYDICNRIFKSDKVFYSAQDIERLQKDSKYIAIK